MFIVISAHVSLCTVRLCASWLLLNWITAPTAVCFSTVINKCCTVLYLFSVWKEIKQFSPRSRSKRNNTPRAYDFSSGLTVLQEKQTEEMTMFSWHTLSADTVPSYVCICKTYLMRMMTDGVWAMAPTRLHTQITQRKMRKASWQPGIWHFPGIAVADSLSEDIQEHPLRFCEWGCRGHMLDLTHP